MMDQIFLFFYRNLLFPILRIGFELFAYCSSSEKLKLTIQLRNQKIEIGPFAERPILIHAASGEIEYAKPVIRELKKALATRQIVVSFFSPSALAILQKTEGVDHYLPLPWDSQQAIADFLNKLNPACLVISRTDLWPELLSQCQLRKIPTLLFSAVYSESNSSQFFLYKEVHRFLVNLLDEVFCVSQKDFENFKALNSKAALTLSGDTRIDQVLYRLETGPIPHKNAQVKFHSTERRQTLILGSTWPEDDKIFLASLDDWISRGNHVIWAPHEIHEDSLNHLKQELTKRNWSFQNLDQLDLKFAAVTLVNEFGKLAELYLRADIAFVGGSFKKKVHNVLEPLAAGIPVLLGPHFHNSREAMEFRTEKTSNDINLVTICSHPNQVKSALAELSRLLKDSDHNEIRGKLLSRTGASRQVSEWIAVHSRS